MKTLIGEYMHMSTSEVRIEVNFELVVGPLIIELSSAGAVNYSERHADCSFGGFFINVRTICMFSNTGSTS